VKENLRAYFKDLSGLMGISGCEQPVVKYMKEKLEPFADEIQVDTSGNVIAVRHGNRPGPRLMIEAHGDEVGFCVKNILANGFLYFDKVGTQSDKVMEGRKVWVKDAIPGIIGIKPGHLQSAEESRRVKTSRECYIDIGMSSKEEVEKLGVKIGDPIVLQSSFMEMTNKDLICTKSVDNRINCAILIELFRQMKELDFAGTVYAVASVQEEVGLRGAAMVGNLIQPDYAIALDTIPAGDTPDVDTEKDLPMYLGKGPGLPVAYGYHFPIFAYAHPQVRKMIEKAAEREKISLQYVTLTGDGYSTNAATLSTAGKGIPTATLTVPRRYSHSPVELFDLNDAVGSLKILKQIVADNENANLSFI